MEAQEFFGEVESILAKTRGSDSVGVEYFISDLDELIEQWEEEKKSIKPKQTNPTG